MECLTKYGGRKWVTKVKMLKSQDSTIEMVVSADGESFHLIIGKHAYGSFLCEPEKGIACELATLSDKFWNRESIGRHCSPAITESFVDALFLIGSSIKSMSSV